MKTATFNKAIGLDGEASNLFGANRKVGTIALTSTTAVKATGSNPVEVLQNEKNQVSQQLTSARSELAAVQAKRQGCKRSIGWDNKCLDQNKAQENQLKTTIAGYEARITQIDKEMPAAQAAYAEQVKTNVISLEAQAKANPETAKQQAATEQARIAAQATAQMAATQAQAKSEQTKLFIYGGVGLGVLAVIAVVLIVIFK